MRCTVTLIVAIAMLVGGVPAAATANGRLAHAATSAEVAVDVAATQPWTDAGLDLAVGDVVRITAAGLIHVRPDDMQGKAPGGEPTCAAGAAFIAPGLPCWSLVARVGSGPARPIGTGATVAATTAGRLSLGVNDDFFADNSGSWRVRLTRGPAAAGSPAAPAQATPAATASASPTASALDPCCATAVIRVDADALLAGRRSARSAARRGLHRVLDRYAGCRLRTALAFGGGPGGGDVARAVNDLMRRTFPAFAAAAYVGVADPSQPRGQITLQLRFVRDCPSTPSAAAGPTPGPDPTPS